MDQNLNLGRVQLRIMQALWSLGEASARTLSEKLNADAPIAHSTVQTLLRQLEAKGLVAHEIRDRAFVFRALAPQQGAQQNAARDLVQRWFAGSAGGLISHLLEHEQISEDELDQIRSMIDGDGGAR